MDDLTFRRTVYSDPFIKSKELIEAAKNDPKKQAFWDEVKQMEGELQQAMNIPVPEGLADKLLLKQSMKKHTERKKRQPWYLAMAASLVVASVLTVSMLNQPTTSLNDDVLAHMRHLDFEVNSSQSVNLDMVNTKLASFNGSISEGLGEILSAKFCYLDSIKSLHITIKGDDGISSLFVMPSKTEKSFYANDFGNDQYTGTSFLTESAKVIVIGESGSQVRGLKDKAQQLLSFAI